MVSKGTSEGSLATQKKLVRQFLSNRQKCLLVNKMLDILSMKNFALNKHILISKWAKNISLPPLPPLSLLSCTRDKNLKHFPHLTKHLKWAQESELGSYIFKFWPFWPVSVFFGLLGLLSPVILGPQGPTALRKCFRGVSQGSEKMSFFTSF